MPQRWVLLINATFVHLIYFVHRTKKPYFCFPNVLKWSFHKNRTGIWSFLYYQERWYFFFPKIWSYSLDTKGKMIFFKKNTWKYDIFFKCSEKMVFPKNSSQNMIFFVISGKIVFLFSKKYDIFSLGGKWKKMIFIKIRLEIWYFLYIWVGVTGATLPSCQKKTKMPRKNAPRVASRASPKKMIFILDSF